MGDIGTIITNGCFKPEKCEQKHSFTFTLTNDEFQSSDFTPVGLRKSERDREQQLGEERERWKVKLGLI